MRVACIGGGPGGLLAAILIARLDGVESVTVHERSPEGITYGWGVVFWDDLLDQLTEHDAPFADALRARAFTWHGQVIEVRGTARDLGGHGYATSRATLRALLTERAREVGVDVRFGSPVDDPAALLPDHDVVIAADGVHSAVRAASPTFGTTVRQGANRYIWLGTDKVFESFTFPFVQTPAGWLWAHAYGYDAAVGSTFVVETSARTFDRLGLGEMGTDATLRELERIFAAQLDGHALTPSAASLETAPWLRFHTVRNERWVDGRVALLGDAAHTTHFTIGSGTRLALQDAMVLATELGRHPDPDTALAAYQRIRIEQLAPTAAEADESAQWFENVERYLAFGPGEFPALLVDRRRTLARRLPAAYVGRRKLLRAISATPPARPVKRVVKRLVGRE